MPSCPYCSNNILLTKEEYINHLINFHLGIVKRFLRDLIERGLV